MSRYYSEKLAAERLKTCYDVAPPAAKAYLDGEIEFVLSKVAPTDSVLELGCGYGRVLAHLTRAVGSLWGIDTSHPSLLMAREYVEPSGPCRLAVMDATKLGFPSDLFDVVVCIQNGISAFGVDQGELLGEAVRVTRPGGTVLFSSYAERFWPKRLEWFRIQAEHGLIGEIDLKASGNGVIVCKDGFRATTVGPKDFRRLAAALGLTPSIVEVKGSSLFCELAV